MTVGKNKIIEKIITIVDEKIRKRWTYEAIHGDKIYKRKKLA